MIEKEYCEECGKEITKEMKASQQVIYANAEHTLDDGEGITSQCDPMFGGVYCCTDCYEEQAGHKIAYKKGYQDAKKEMIEEFEKIIDENITNAMMKFNYSNINYSCSEVKLYLDTELRKQLKQQLNQLKEKK